MLNLLLPVILLIITGWVCVHFKMIDAEVVESGLNQFLFKVALPAIIFLSVTTISLSKTNALKYTIAYTLITIVTFLISFVLARKCFNRNMVESHFAGLSASVSNAALIGLPILVGLFGIEASVPVALTLIVFLLFLLPIFTIIIEYNLNRDARNFSKTLIAALKNTIVNPLIVAAIAALIVNLLHFPLPKFILTYLQYLSDATVPCSLVVIGMTLHQVQLKKDISELITMSTINLIFKPILAIGFAIAFKLNPFYATGLLVACSVPTSKSLYIIAKQYKIYEIETAGIIFLTSILSLISFPIFLSIAEYLWMGK